MCWLDDCFTGGLSAHNGVSLSVLKIAQTKRKAGVSWDRHVGKKSGGQPRLSVEQDVSHGQENVTSQGAISPRELQGGAKDTW